MSKYIDADRLKVEIERREKIIRNSANQIFDSKKKSYYAGCADALLELLPFIDSLQQEQPQVADASKMEQVELEKEINRYQREDMDRDTTVRDVARHFYELGLNARKEG